MASQKQFGSMTEDAIGSGDAVALPTISGIADGLMATLRHRRPIVKASYGLGIEAVRILLGKSDRRPERSDWRFKDPAWSDNPVYSRVAQLYLAWCASVDDVLDDVAESASEKQVERARFAMNILTTALAPTNTLVGNPAALKRTFDSAGANLVKGFGNFATDLRHNGGMPAQSKRGAFTVGEDLALSPGQVIDKDDMAELLHYAPSSESVFELPVLVVPPPIGRYYFLDLRPGRSFIEYSVSRGLQSFLISWRNPSAEQSHWDIDAYAERILAAVDAVREVTNAASVNIVGFCAGGMMNSIVLNKLASLGDDRICSATFAVTLLDFGKSAPINAFSSARLIDFAGRRTRKAGITSARAMGSAFTWMRPNDLVWNYWVNNYLMGEDPPVFDILSWNADGTNLASALHQQFLEIFRTNPLPTAGALTGLGATVDLDTIKVPSFVVGAVNDHLTPWKSTYQTTQLLGGDSTFVLSNAGHIAALVNPPGNPKASYFTGQLRKGETPEGWLEGATKQSGSWWESWADWVTDQAGARIDAPTELGSERFAPQATAPGSYVRQQN